MKNFMKDYESPIFSIIFFVQDDVIRTSVGTPDKEFSSGFSGEDEEFIFG